MTLACTEALAVAEARYRVSSPHLLFPTFSASFSVLDQGSFGEVFNMYITWRAL